MTLLSDARRGRLTPLVKAAAEAEGAPPEELLADVAAGRTIIPANRARTGVRATAIGRNLSVKVNANIGASSDQCDPAVELAKLEAALAAGAHTIMDLSTAGDLNGIRRSILSRCPVPLGTVPIYQAAVEAAAAGGGVVDLDQEKLFDVIERQAADGVDFITVHCGFTLESLGRLKNQGRLMDVVSRGGAFLATWMLFHQRENPLFSEYDRLLDIAARHDVTLSLGDGLRPGCLADATDRAQVQELIVLGELADRASAAGVQVMIEGPGHVPLDQVETNVRLEKSLCRGAPFYVLGPLVTDAAAGHDHIACAIGGAVAGMAGADILCYVTPSEHLRLPDAEDVRQGVIATRIAAHAADLARGRPQAWERDNRLARARKALDWDTQIELALDSAHAGRMHREQPSSEEGVCTMCGPYCAVKLVNDFLQPQPEGEVKS